MKAKFFKNAALVLALGLSTAACNKKLNVTPIVGNNPNNVYDNVSSISDIVAKLYGGYVLSGKSAGDCDLGNYDPGTSVLYRCFWVAQELPTDEVKMSWNDGNLPDLNTNTWNADNDKLHLLYDRTFYEISICNEFIRNMPASKVASFSGTDGTTVKNYVAEARFIRSLTYWLAMDFYGNIPFATETSTVGATPPKLATRAQVFAYVTSELLAIQNDLMAPRANYGRIDQACAWTLLSKLYLNSEVYTGVKKYDSAAIFAKKVIDAGYSLAPSYVNLFKIDNQTTSNSEIIFPLRCNGVTSQSYGNSTFLVNAGVGNKDNPGDFGISSGWAGYRATPNLVALFPNALNTSDTRALFDSAGQTLDMPVLLNYPNGYGIHKFRNVSSTGTAGSSQTFADLDIPFFRLADVYLIYAEASLRNSGDEATALTYVNMVRTRAGATPMDASGFAVDSILAERGRELYCEGTRRTDLIRFGYYNSATYLWPWKGGSLNGVALDAHLNLFPIPTTDLNLNPNLKQNTGY